MDRGYRSDFHAVVRVERVQYKPEAQASEPLALAVQSLAFGRYEHSTWYGLWYCSALEWKFTRG